MVTCNKQTNKYSFIFHFSNRKRKQQPITNPKMSLNGVKAAKAPTSSSNSLALAFFLLLSSSCIIVSAETETFAGTAASDSTALQVAGKADEKAAAAAAQTDADEALFSDNSAGSQMGKVKLNYTTK